MIRTLSQVLRAEGLDGVGEFVAVVVPEDVQLAWGSEDDPSDTLCSTLGDAEERAHRGEELSMSASFSSFDCSRAV